MPIVQTSLKSKNYNALGIDEIADDISNIITVVNAIPESPTTAIVNITSAQILAMGSVGIELLPAPGVNAYYDVHKMVIEYTHNTTAYTIADPFINFGLQLSSINSNILTQGFNQAYIVSGSAAYVDGVEEVVWVGNSLLNGSLGIYTWNGTDPTLGDGTMRAIITYTVRTFGA